VKPRILVACLLCAGPASAQRSADLIYTRGAGAEQCANEAGLRSAVATRLGYDPFARPGPKSGTVSASIGRVADGTLQAVVRLDSPSAAADAQRELQSAADDCDELAAAVALTISILVDPRAAMGGGPSPARVSAAPPDTCESPFAPETPLPPAPVRAAPLGVRVGFDTVATVGAAPAPAFGVAAFVGLQRRWVSLDLEGRADLPASTMRDDGTGVRSSLLLGTLSPCAHAGVVALCAVGSVGALRGQGIGAGSPERDATAYVAFGPRAAVEVPVAEAVVVRSHVDAVVPVTQTTLRSRGVEYWTTPPVYLALAVGAFGRF
jgi:hypothetical protein